MPASALTRIVPHLWYISEAEEAARLEGLRHAVQVGLDDIANDRYLSFDSIEALQDHLSGLTEEVISTTKSA